MSTDKLIPIGVVNSNLSIQAVAAAGGSNGRTGTGTDNSDVVKSLVGGQALKRVPRASPAAAMVLAACHSLVQVGGCAETCSHLVAALVAAICTGC